MEKPSRSELRKIIMTILYQKSIYEKNKINFTIDNLISSALEIDNEFVKDTVYGVITYQNEIDKLINKYLNNWTIDRIESIGACILRMSIYEIKYMDTPDIVVINEAIELAKKYSDDKVKNMINAVLDKIVNGD